MTPSKRSIETTVKRWLPSTVDVNDVTLTGAPEAPLIAVCCMVASTVEEAVSAKRRMTMLLFSVEEAIDISYEAMLAASGSCAVVNPVGIAKDRRTSPIGIETFGNGHTWKVQEEPLRETDVPSGHCRASSGQTIGCNGCSDAFLYTRPATPTRIMNKMPLKRPFMCPYYQKIGSLSHLPKEGLLLFRTCAMLSLTSETLVCFLLISTLN